MGELKTDLDSSYVNQWWIEGTIGNIGEGRSRGYSLGEAEYITYADHDDRIIPSSIEECISFLDKNQDYSCVGTAEYVGVKIVREIYNFEEHKVFPDHFHGLIIYRRDKVKDVLEKLKDFHYLPDWYLSLYASTKGKVGKLEVPGRSWRQHCNQATRVFDEEMKEERERILIELDSWKT
jgi:hypothetical protein